MAYESLFPESQLSAIRRDVARFKEDHELGQDEALAAAREICELAGRGAPPERVEEEVAFAAVARQRGLRCWRDAVFVLSLEEPGRALLDAARRGDVEEADRLLEETPGAIRPTARGEVAGGDQPDVALPLVQASRGVMRHGHGRGAAMARLLLEAGADPSANGWVAVISAARFDQAELLGVLLDAGVPLDGPEGDSAWLAWALRDQARSTAALLAGRGARLDMIAAAGLGDLDAIARFVRPDGSLREGAGALRRPLCPPRDPDDRQVILDEALVLAVINGERAAARRLVELGADANGAPGGTDVPEATALHWAAMLGDTAMVALLLALGADPGVCDQRHGETAAAWAAYYDHAPTAALLERHAREPEGQRAA